jgi:peptidoglycan/LPS O-acetylase OafA/YrhL
MQIPRNPKYRSLDLWRGVACLAVLANHGVFKANDHEGVSSFLDTVGMGLANICARLWIGVPIFFVISGYCIAATADSNQRRKQSLKDYFYRRFRRIYPPYWILLGAIFIIYVLLDRVLISGILTSTHSFMAPWWFSPSQWFGNLTLTETWRYHVIGGDKGLWMGHAWTLCYEEQFYLVMGLLLLLSPRRLFVGAAAVTGLTLVTAYGCKELNIPIEGFFFDGSWILFAIGILVYYRINYATFAQGRWLNVLLFSGMIYALKDPAELLEIGKNEAQTLFVAFSFGLLISLLHSRDNWISSTRMARPLMFCGTLCYSLYLVHLPIAQIIQSFFVWFDVPMTAAMSLLTVPLCACISIPAAWGFYQLVEKYFLNSSPKLGALSPSLATS